MTTAVEGPKQMELGRAWPVEEAIPGLRAHPSHNG
jgi:hypothetical protein